MTAAEVQRSDRWGRWVWAAVSVLLVTLPFLPVEFIPITDLPQHLGQLRLFGEALRGDTAGLQIQWWTPYSLVYAVMALPWLLLPAVLAGKVAVWLLVALQVAALHLVAARYRRPAVAAVLASALIFNSQFYWGFLNFQLGSVVFLAWVAASARSNEVEASGWRIALCHTAVGLLLYLSHVLWFAFGMVWMAVDAVVCRPSRRELAWRALGVMPVVAAAAYWYVFLQTSSFFTPPQYAASPLGRLTPLLVHHATLGGILHPIDALVVVVGVAWIAIGTLSRRPAGGVGIDRRLAALGLLLLAVYLFVPDKFSNTIRFSTRWMPYCVMVGLLAVRELPLRRIFRGALAVVVLSTLMVVNVVYWRSFEREELSGLAAALARLPEAPRVIGLNYLEGSTRITGQPYLQCFAWAYAIHGGDLNFSFSYFAPSLVVADPSHVRWTWGLEWFPKRVRRSDFQHFDYALVSGDAEAHRRMEELPELEPMVADEVWRLYRVVTPAAPPAPVPPGG